MPHFCVANVADDAGEVVLVVGVVLGRGVRQLFLLVVVEGVGVEVEGSGELVLVGDLLVNEGVHVKVNPLQVEDQVLRGLAYTRSFGNIGLLTTEIAFIVTNQLSQNKPAE